MNNVENTQVTIDSTTNSTTIDIPLRVEMTSIDDAKFEFNTSIDEVGQVLLTPTTKSVEFVSVETQGSTEDETPIMERETKVDVETDSSSMMFTRKKTSILIRATMLVEDSDNLVVNADVDDIGQVVIYPAAEKNTFVTAAVDDSLNLITEGFGVEVIEYCDGYKLINPGNYWYVKDRNQRMIGQGFETVKDAKIFVCNHELEELNKLTEDVDSSNDENTDDIATEEIKPEVEAEVIDESVSDNTKITEFDDAQIEAAIVEITDNYTVESGVIKCDTKKEKTVCVDLLTKHYNNIVVELERNYILITYSNVQRLIEEIKTDSRLDIINKFMQGDIPLFSDSGVPDDKYEHIEELDSNGYEYYYDPESGCIVSYPAR